MEDDNMPWHIIGEEGKYYDNEMALQSGLFISFRSVSQLLMTSNAITSFPRLTRD